MITYKIFNSSNASTISEKEEIVKFLFEHLDQYGDPEEDIRKSIDFALKEYNSAIIPLGGFVLIAKNNNDIVGAVVINKTGMQGYIPENILVYIATHKEFRGMGIGEELMNKSLDIAKGSIALHVEPDNPAKFLYEKVGFTNKYLEMRFTHKN